MATIRTRWFPVALAIAGACSSHGSAPDNGSASAPAAAAAKAPDPCGLITDAEAGAALGGPAKHEDKGSRDASNGNGVKVTETRCNYNLVTSDQSGHNIYVAVYGAADREYYNETGTKTDNGPIAGLGDAAKGISTDHIFVFSKGTMLQIYGSLGDGTGLVDITRVAIAKL